MTRVPADFDRLAQLDLGHAFFQMAENTEQFFRCLESAVAVPVDAERGGHKFLEFRA